MKRKRAGALFIQSQKLLLISEGGKNQYWTPGGGLESGETYLEALRRELDEELGAVLLDAKLYHVEDETHETVKYFLVDITLPSDPKDPTTKMYWYSKSDFDQATLPISRRIFSIVYPKLLAEQIIT